MNENSQKDQNCSNRPSGIIQQYVPQLRYGVPTIINDVIPHITTPSLHSQAQAHQVTLPAGTNQSGDSTSVAGTLIGSDHTGSGVFDQQSSVAEHIIDQDSQSIILTKVEPDSSCVKMNGESELLLISPNWC